MNHAIVFGLVAVLLGFTSVQGEYDDPPHRDYGDPHAVDPKAGYGSRPSGRTYNYYPPPPPPPPAKMDDKNELDKVYSRFEDVLTQLKTADEKLEAMTSRLAAQRRVVQELIKVTFEKLKNNDATQDDSIDDLKSRITNAISDIGDVRQALGNLATTTAWVHNAQFDLKVNLANRWGLDLENISAIKGLIIRIRWLKEKLLQEITSQFQVALHIVNSSASKLHQIKTFAGRRKCESGKVSLDSDDRRALYLYQQTYDIVPQVTYGLCGFNFNIDSDDKKKQAGGGGYGYNPYGYNPYGYRQHAKPKIEPHAIGLSTSAFSSLNGLSLEMFDTGFGASTLVTADVCFLVCSLGPSIGPVDH